MLEVLGEGGFRSGPVLGAVAIGDGRHRPGDESRTVLVASRDGLRHRDPRKLRESSPLPGLLQGAGIGPERGRGDDVRSRTQVFDVQRAKDAATLRVEERGGGEERRAGVHAALAKLRPERAVEDQRAVAFRLAVW